MDHTTEATALGNEVVDDSGADPITLHVVFETPVAPVDGLARAAVVLPIHDYHVVVFRVARNDENRVGNGLDQGMPLGHEREREHDREGAHLASIDTIVRCWSSVSSGNIGSASVSRAARSASGKSPGPWPRSEKHGCSGSGTG